MKKLTNYLNQNLFELLQFTMIRLDNFKSNNFEKLLGHLYSYNTSKEDILIEKKDIFIYINHKSN